MSNLYRTERKLLLLLATSDFFQKHKFCDHNVLYQAKYLLISPGFIENLDFYHLVFLFKK